MLHIGLAGDNGHLALKLVEDRALDRGKEFVGSVPRQLMCPVME